MGCLWAAKLYQHGIKPTFILRPCRYKQLSSNSVLLKMTDAHGNQTENRIKVTTAEEITQPIDKLIVTTKAQHAREAVFSVKNYLNEKSAILLLQNGMGSQQEIVDLLPNSEVCAGSSTDGAYLIEPFHVCHAGQGTTWIGHLSPKTNNLSSSFKGLLDNFGLDVRETASIEQKLWLKLAINCCINGLTALYKCQNGALLSNETRRSHLYRITQETEYALETLGVNLQMPLRQAVEEVCHKTAENISSTRQDSHADRTTELKYINAFLIHLAQEHSLPMRENKNLLEALQQQGVKF